jgi:PAS domain S-box-containing protein
MNQASAQSTNPAGLRKRTPMDLRGALDEHAIVVITDPQGRITYVNNRFCNLSKYLPEDLLGEDHRVINSVHHPREFSRSFWTAIKRGEVWHGEIKSRAKDGGVYWIATTIVPFLDRSGNALQFMAIGADITAQKRVEAELAEKLRLQQLLANLSTRFVGLQSGQVDAAIEETQRLIVETLGLDRSTLWQVEEHSPGMKLTHYWQRSGFPALPQGFSTEENLPWAHARLTCGESICFSRVEDLPPEAARDVEIFRLHGPKSNATFPLIANGRVFGALAFATLGSERTWREDELAELNLVTQIIGNVVSRQRAEMREEQLREELSHAMRVATLGELAAALAHELNQPLAAMLSNAQAARRFLTNGEFVGQEIREILDDIVRDNKRAGSVIQNLRAMAAKRPVARETCCLNQLVCEVIELMHGELVSERIEVRRKLAPQLPTVEAARVELQQVLMNLFVNAVHAMHATPVKRRFIEVETGADDAAVTLSISDQGQGIPPERLPMIFDPFFSTKAQGLGLGLSICRRIIENHNGRIEAGKQADGGARFTFSLPTART